MGTLWESRFESLQVEGDAETLMIVAAFVDLNAVRAGMVTDPKKGGVTQAEVEAVFALVVN